jgi:hypothetical protein
VQEANLVLDLTCFLILVGWLSNRHFVMEQPISSLINFMPEHIAMMEITGARTTTTAHGGFSKGSQKMLKLMGTPSWLPRMRRSVPRAQAVRFALVRSVQTQRGRKVYGLKAKVRASEHYCPAFGRAVADYASEYYLCEV